MCLITAVCVFGQLEKWWKLEPCFTLSAESRSCFVWRPKAMSQTSCLFIYQPLSKIYSPLALYRFCPSFLFSSCWDSNLKLKQRWRFRTARRNSAVSFKKIKKEVCWCLRDPDIRLYWYNPAGEHVCDVSGKLVMSVEFGIPCHLFPSVSVVFPIILSYS